MRFWRVWRGWLALQVASEMAYKLNFIMKMFAMITFDSFGPLLAYVIYNVSSGLPGWSFSEFLLMQGVWIFTTGLTHLLFFGFAGSVLENVRDGNFDLVMIKPANPLLLGLATGADMDGASRVVVGAVVSTYALVKMGWIASIANFAAFALLIIAAILFLLSLQIIIAAMSFVYVKTWTLMNIFDVFVDIGKNPISVLGPVGMAFFSYGIPIGLAAFYPASALLGKIAIMNVMGMFFIGLGFFAMSVGLWNFGIKRYTSAGG
ncbi:MAG: ABC-2 family transporter protein [archaeon]